MTWNLNMKAPTPSFTTVSCGKTGNTYQTDSSGVIYNVDPVDMQDLLAAGYTVIDTLFGELQIPIWTALTPLGQTLPQPAANNYFGFGISYGDNFWLQSEFANNSTVEDAALFCFFLPNSCPPNYNPTVEINYTLVLGAGTLTGNAIGCALFGVNPDGTMGPNVMSSDQPPLLNNTNTVQFSTAGATTNFYGGQFVTFLIFVSLQESSGNAEVWCSINSIKMF